MSSSTAVERYFGSKGFVARLTPRTGWGLFAEMDYEPGKPIFWLNTHETASSAIVKWVDSFGACFDRGFTIVPDFGFCSSPDHAYWHLNHSCNPNAGYVNWGRIEKGSVPIVAHRYIHQGEQITADYSTFTACYDGTPEGDPWQMEDCMCGEPNCRGVITGFEALPLEIQLQNVLATGPAHGRVLAHILEDVPSLVETLRQREPALYKEYQSVLNELYAQSAEFQKTVESSCAPSPRNIRDGSYAKHSR